ncbi:MAG TPA: hypothetical protein VKF37_16175 [Chloroflexota bacterium]|nr:hypothetical protein [Chloroflexota bacterium]
MSTTTPWPLTIEVDDLPPSPNRRMHWGTRRRITRPLAESVAWQARAVGLPQPLQHAHVVAKLTFSRPPLRDIDNAFASLKEVLDGLVVGGLVIDDGPEHLTLGVVQVLGPHRGLTLEVWSLEVEP